MKKYHIGTLLCSLLLPLVVGMLSAAMTSRAMTAYGGMNKPPLSPPAWLFPVAWTILYLMMGLASYYVLNAQADSRSKSTALIFYGVQLMMNFMWSILFFNCGMYLLAFFWLLALWCIVIICAFRFFSISKTAAWLLVPYILWLSFAGYLNLGAHMLKQT